MSIKYGNQDIPEIRYGNVTIGEAMMDGQIVYRSVMKITATAPMEATLQIREELTRRGLDYTTIEKLPFKIDTSEATNLSWMFGDFLALKEVPAMDTSNVTDMSAMFWSCNALTAVPDLNTSKVTVADNMFQNCNSLIDGNVKLIGRKTGVSTTGMIATSSLSREPFFTPTGTAIPTNSAIPKSNPDYWYTMEDGYHWYNRGTTGEWMFYPDGPLSNRVDHAWVARRRSRATVHESWSSGFTLAGWFQMTGSYDKDQHLLGRGWSPNVTQFYIMRNGASGQSFSEKISVGIARDGQVAWIDPGYYLPVEQWTHVAVTHAPGNITTIYLNGQMIHSEAKISGSQLSFPANDELAIASSYVAGLGFDGNIDDIAAWSRPLGANEINSIYLDGPIPTSALTPGPAPQESVIRRTGSGTLTIPEWANEYDYLILGGGSAGHDGHSGNNTSGKGGLAGSYAGGTMKTNNSSALEITIGRGGRGTVIMGRDNPERGYPTEIRADGSLHVSAPGGAAVRGWGGGSAGQSPGNGAYEGLTITGGTGAAVNGTSSAPGAGGAAGSGGIFGIFQHGQPGTRGEAVIRFRSNPR